MAGDANKIEEKLRAAPGSTILALSSLFMWLGNDSEPRDKHEKWRNDAAQLLSSIGLTVASDDAGKLAAVEGQAREISECLDRIYENLQWVRGHTNVLLDMGETCC